MVFPSSLREPLPFWNLFYISIVYYNQRCHQNWFWESYLITTKKNTGLRGKNFCYVEKKSIFRVFPAGLRESYPFWSLFYISFIYFHYRCHLNWFWGLSKYYQKVTGLRVKNFGARKKAILLVFPYSLREPRPYWNLFYISIVYYNQKCHKNWFWESYLITIKKIQDLEERIFVTRKKIKF